MTYQNKIEETERLVGQLQEICHGLAKEAGWWNDLETGEPLPPKNIGLALMLCVSELAEAFEGARKGLMDEHLPHRKMLEVELADTVIRICDLAGGYGLDLGGALAEKLRYNTQRADHKKENRAKSGGKQF